jgi:hypothetical protein
MYIIIDMFILGCRIGSINFRQSSTDSWWRYIIKGKNMYIYMYVNMYVSMHIYVNL